MAFAAARIIKDKKDQQELKLIKSPECAIVNRTGKKVDRYTVIMFILRPVQNYYDLLTVLMVVDILYLPST